MDSPEHDHLRVLVANERQERIGLITTIVAALGHTVIAGTTDVTMVGALTAREHPDVALVGLGHDTNQALDLIGRIVHEASCPVITLLESRNSEFVTEAARRGVFAYIVDTDPESLQSAIDITLRRYAEFRGLQGAFGRRAVTERAKGIMMERHQIDEHDAFELLRTHARRSGHKVTDIAQAIVDGHALLPPHPVTAPLTSAD